MYLEPINNDSIVNEIFKRITNSIIKGELRPGDKLPTEVEFAEQLGVGRNSVREAVKMMTAMGVLEIKRGAGTFVTTKVSPSIFNPLMFSMIIEPKSNSDLYELRVMFESMVLFIVIDKASDEDILNIERLLEETKRASLEGAKEIEYFIEADLRFHNEILKAAHNPLIERIGTTINELFPAYMKNSMTQSNGIERSIRNHYEILTIIKSKDKEKVFEIVELTLKEWKNSWAEQNED